MLHKTEISTGLMGLLVLTPVCRLNLKFILLILYLTMKAPIIQYTSEGTTKTWRSIADLQRQDLDITQLWTHSSKLVIVLIIYLCTKYLYYLLFKKSWCMYIHGSRLKSSSSEVFDWETFDEWIILCINSQKQLNREIPCCSVSVQ